MPKVQQYPDARVTRTRGLLKKALLALLEEKPFSGIRIKEIAERARVNRVTFYDHYVSKEELLSELIDEVLTEYGDIIEGMPRSSLAQWPPTNYLGTIRLSVGHIKKHADFYRIMLLTNGVPDFSNRLHDQMSLSLHESMRSMGEVSPDVSLDLFVDWIIGGAIGVYKYWLQEGLRQSEEEIAQQMLKITLASSGVFKLKPR
ncbi:TetR/AcrR family transcriptional regulator [Cohnella nanjingensis]|uniref:TetR/AcrR family transcriptional regulator n=1 Tax=Cohnella nanjingensis TaxID=1387779 RepID=A0A7X0RNE9_9BACL|nr:TetR/AcrR family transcriptional regulator [Cohnella nanjingensis]MBB6669556.1 TetR/AcrR family transcriptional regulator [Cohnella nanjingensis]